MSLPDTAAIAPRRLPIVPGLGLSISPQRLPSQWTINVRDDSIGALDRSSFSLYEPYVPTAQILSLERATTPAKLLRAAPSPSGLYTSFHLCPSQCSTIVCEVVRG